MGNLDARRDTVRRIGVRILRYQIDLANAFGMKLEGDLLRRQFAVDMLATGHRNRVVIEDLVGDIGFRGDRLADGENTGMEIGAVAEIGEDVLLIGERRNPDPGHALAAHMSEGFGVAIHPERHEMAADAGKRSAALGHLGGGVVRAARAEIGHPRDRGDRLHLGRLAAVEPVGLGAQHLGDFRVEIEAQQPLRQRACE